MKWFWRGKGSTKKAPKQEQTTRCNHPVSHQVILREDASAPTKVTSIKCTQCGERLTGGSSPAGSKGEAA